MRYPILMGSGIGNWAITSWLFSIVMYYAVTEMYSRIGNLADFLFDVFRFADHRRLCESHDLVSACPFSSV